MALANILVSVNVTRRNATELLVPPPVSVGGFTRIQIDVPINETDKLDPSKSLSWGIYVAQDGVNYGDTAVVAGTWVGYGPGGYTDKNGNVNPNPSITVGYADPLPAEALMEARVSIPVSIRCGAIVSAE